MLDEKILFIVFLLTGVIKASSQDYNFAPDCLGIWCTVDIDLTNPPTISTFQEYPIPNPPEEIGVANTIRDEVVIVHQEEVFRMGPGRPYINNWVGGSPILCIDLKRLNIDLMEYGMEALISFPVQKLSVYGDQCYYYIRLQIRR